MWSMISLYLDWKTEFFFFNDTAPTEIYTLSLHDALPISLRGASTWCECARPSPDPRRRDRKSTRLNSSHMSISYAVFCLKKKKNKYLPIANPSFQTQLIYYRISITFLSLPIPLLYTRTTL